LIYAIKNNSTEKIILLLVIIGLLLPTSKNIFGYGEAYLWNYLILFIFLIKILWNQKKIDLRNFNIAIFSMFLLLFFTLISNATYFSWGAIINYILVFVMLNLDIKEKKINKRLFFSILNVINIVIIITNVLTILGNSFVKNMLIEYYSIGESIVEKLIIWYNKPIFTFGSHSIASFFYYLFFSINLEIFKKTNKKLYFLYSILYLLIQFYLKSNSSIFFILIIFFELSIFFYNKNKWILGIVICCFLFFLLYFKEIYYVLKLQDIIFSTSNGIIGRYSDVGVLAVNIEYLKNNIFRGIGFSYYDDLYYTDSGPIINTLRGTFLFSFLFYLNVYLFITRSFKNGLKSKKFFIIVFVFEFAYNILLYFRFLYFIPFYIVCMNSVDSDI
jgi:hypothetical protein